MAETVITNVTLSEIKRASMQLELAKRFPILLTEMRVWDDFASLLPNAAAADDLGLVMGTFGTGSPSLQSVDFGGTSTTAYARFLWQVPPEFDSTLKVRMRVGMLTTASDSTADFDVEVYESDKEAGVGSDLCTTDAQGNLTTTLADKDFVIDTSGIVWGDVLDIRLKFNGVDSTDAGVMKGIIGDVAMIMDARG